MKGIIFDDPLNLNAGLPLFYPAASNIAGIPWPTTDFYTMQTGTAQRYTLNGNRTLNDMYHTRFSLTNHSATYSPFDSDYEGVNAWTLACRFPIAGHTPPSDEKESTTEHVRPDSESTQDVHIQQTITPAIAQIPLQTSIMAATLVRQTRYPDERAINLTSRPDILAALAAYRERDGMVPSQLTDALLAIDDQRDVYTATSVGPELADFPVDSTQSTSSSRHIVENPFPRRSQLVQPDTIPTGAQSSDDDTPSHKRRRGLESTSGPTSTSVPSTAILIPQNIPNYPSLITLDLANSRDCVWYTMYYMTHGTALPSDMLEQQKKNTLDNATTIRDARLLNFITQPRSDVLPAWSPYETEQHRYVDSHCHKMTTVFAYSHLLQRNVHVYFRQCLGDRGPAGCVKHIHNVAWDTISLYVEKPEREHANAHMKGIIFDDPNRGNLALPLYYPASANIVTVEWPTTAFFTHQSGIAQKYTLNGNMNINEMRNLKFSMTRHSDTYSPFDNDYEAMDAWKLFCRHAIAGHTASSLLRGGSSNIREATTQTLQNQIKDVTYEPETIDNCKRKAESNIDDTESKQQKEELRKLKTVTTIDLQNPTNCVFYTMYYLAKGKILMEQELQKEKNKTIAKACTEQNEKFRKLMESEGSDFSHIQTRDEYNCRKSYYKLETHNITTIAAYSRVLGVKTRLYVEDQCLIFSPGEEYDWNWISLYADGSYDDDDHHMFGVLDAQDGSRGKILQGPNTRTQYPWHRGTKWRYDVTEQITGNWKTPEQNERKYIQWRIGMYKTNTITSETNSARQRIGQERLIQERHQRQAEVELQAHDTGSFVQAKVIHAHTNNLRKLASQERLVMSTSKSDLDMFEMALHDENEYHNLMLNEELRCRLMKSNDLSKTCIPATKTVWANLCEELGEQPERLYLSQIQNPKNITLLKMQELDNQCLPMLSDSGATRCVIGKGMACNRLLENYVVGFDSENNGWVHKDSMETKNNPLPKLRKKYITVASGEIIDAIAINKLHLGLQARKLIGNEWSKDSETIFIGSQDAAVSTGIDTTVFSEGHFLEHNTKWTTIYQGKKKYMVYTKVSLNLESHGIHPPLRVDFRENKGEQYLDTTTILTDTGQVKARDKVSLTQVDPNKETETQSHINLNVIDVSEPNHASTDTGNMDTYEEYVNVRHISTTEGESSIQTTKGYRDRWPKDMTMEDCMTKVHKIMENPNAEDWEKIEAVDVMSIKVKKLNDWKNLYTTKRAEMIHVNNAKTRSQSRVASNQGKNSNAAEQETSETDAGTPVHPEQPTTKEQVEITNNKTQQDSEHMDLSAYDEYDKTYQSARDTKKRVHFEDRVLVEAEIEVEQAEYSQSRKIPKQKQSKADKNLQKQQRKDEISEDETNEIQEQNEDKNRKIDEALTQEYELYKDLQYESTTNGPGQVQVFSDDQFKDDSKIDRVNDETLAIFLMENKVKL